VLKIGWIAQLSMNKTSANIHAKASKIYSSSI